MAWHLYLFSDLHLEINGSVRVMKVIEQLDKIHIEPDDLLVLAGDIFSPNVITYEKFFTYVNKKFNTILYVLGNHEYYSKGNNYLLTKNKIRQVLAPFTNVHILDNETYVHRGIKFIGTTLWTKITRNFAFVEAKANDYHQIYKNNKPIRVTDVNSWNRKNVEWLEVQLENVERLDEQCIVITHHAPLYNDPHQNIIVSSHDRVTIGLEEVYHNDLSRLLNKKILAWCYGHTHHATNFTYKDVIFFSNPFGYPGEETGFILTETLLVES